jgi:UDP-glucoronosyl and UDP-glucosyl transferase
VLEHTGEGIGMHLVGDYVMPRKMAALTGDPSFGFTELMQTSSIYFTDAIESLGYSTATVTDLKSIGAHCEVPKALTNEYLEFVDDPASKGTIYIAFGTFIPWDFAPEKSKKAVFSALARLHQYRIVFAFNGKFPSEPMPSHIKLVSHRADYHLRSMLCRYFR